MAGKVKNLGSFFQSVGQEMKRVSWPTRKELTRYTLVVIATVTIMTIFFAIIDLGISELVRLL